MHMLFGCLLRGGVVRNSRAEFRAQLDSLCDSRAAAGVRLACRGTAKTVALAVTNQSSFSSLMADLKEKFDTKDENSSGVSVYCSTSILILLLL
jgi:hypothetical protein